MTERFCWRNSCVRTRAVPWSCSTIPRLWLVARGRGCGKTLTLAVGGKCDRHHGDPIEIQRPGAIAVGRGLPQCRPDA